MKELFKIFGADEKEMGTYLKLLELGPQPVSVIAKQMFMPRSSMYVVLDRLKDLQLIEEFERVGIKYVKSISAKNLTNLIKTRELTLERGLDLINEKLPELESIENRLGITPKVRFFEGKRSVMRMYEEILQQGGFCAFFNPALVKKMMPEYHFKIGETIKENKWHVRELLIDCPEALEYEKKFKSSLHEIKILKKSVKFKSDTIITDGKIYMISYGEDDLTGTEIVNQSLSDTQLALFELAWEKV